MFEDFTYANLMQRMLDRVSDDLDKREGSVIWDALSPAALELEFGYITLDYILNQGFGDTAERDCLILRARERGLEPYEASRAVIKGVFTPATANVAGKRFNLGDLNFTVGDAIEGEEGAYQLTCETAGAEGNKVLGRLIPMEYVEGLETATATKLLIPGEDEEPTEDFRERYFQSFREKGYGGNVQDYINKVSALEGVGGVRVTPTWNGGGTVKCTILDGNYGKATSTLIQSVQNAIDPTRDGNGMGVAPIGHIVTIDTPDEVTININVIVEFDTGYSWNNMQSLITNAISNYLLELRTNWKNYESGQSTTIRISQIETRLLALNGVLDVTQTSVNNSESNYVISGNDIPVLGAITHEQNG